ncbi:asparagine synthase (glutamine-hydrolyzing) [Rosistilla oblonga]|uniref:asparagine synthase (glutamine-hydrolyzing) n=1 Tax=Rosistilla oblonga TaxID=2527990 RepID=UPI003A9791CF
MCGILGILDRSGAAPTLTDPQVIAIRDRMAARGPDDATLLRRDNLILAHRRLAIRDPDAGRQPWVSEDGSCALVYNGEIYNDDVLRHTLRSHGFRFRTQCDTEVLMDAWLHWGEKCVEHLRGMFAFGVYDFQKRQLFIARDRFGVKPLFYAELGQQFVFASSIAAITAHPDFRPQPNLSTIRHYLSTFRITLDTETVFAGIQTVRPAETLTLADDKLTSSIYWTPPPRETMGLAFDDAVDRFEETISEAVSIRLRSDVPVGMMLSGGVDSNLLAALLHRNEGVSMTARCGGGIDPELDSAGNDFEYARRCAQHVGFDFDQVTVSATDYHRTWMELIAAYETPISTPTDAIIYRVAQQLKQQVGVALGGEGADEACCGYLIPHWSGNDFDLSRALDSLAPAAAQTARDSLLQQYGTATFASAGDHYLAANGLISAATQASLFHDTTWPAAFADGSVERFYDRQFRQLGDLSGVEKTAHLLLRVNLECLLSRLDSATMTAGLESRVPYTDHHFVEQMFRQPFGYCIDVAPGEALPHRAASALAADGSLRGKRLLRAVAGNRMPAELAQRPKASFPTPVPHWLGGQWQPWLQELYRTSPFAQQLFRREALDELCRLPNHLASWHWPIANTILWGDRWF